MSKGINPAGTEHNKCDVLKLLRSAIRLCKLIGDIPQQTAKRDVKKKKTWTLLSGQVPIFRLVREFWGFGTMRWTKWPNPAHLHHSPFWVHPSP